MLYFGVCRKCAFQVHALDAQLFKQRMASHLNASHREDIVFVADSRIKDFSSDFKIDRIRDENIIIGFLNAVKHKSYWKVQRINPKNLEIPIFISGLSSGE